MGLIQLFKEAPVIPNITQVHHVKMANQTPVTLFLTRQTSEEWVESAARVEGGMNVHVGDWVVAEYDQMMLPTLEVSASGIEYS